jgi:predicted membrane-bound mannosyltransferase/sugar lactone lactonase YvrE
MMHGPFQFHILALTYFLFGVSDFTARIPAALFSIAIVGMVWYWRRYLGYWGALVAAFLMVISPYMLYYGRYVRNESFVAFSGILLLYSVLRYFDTGRTKYLYLVTIATVLHFTSKETSFIYTAQLLSFLGIYFIIRVTGKKWEQGGLYKIFIVLLALAVLLAGVSVGIGYLNRHETTLSGTETAAPSNPGSDTALQSSRSTASATTFLFVASLVLLVAAGIVMLVGYGWNNIRKERSFDLLMLVSTFVLPMLVAFPLDWLKSTLNVAIPTDAASVAALDSRALIIIGAFVVLFFIISVIAGMLWNNNWWKYAIVFWGPYLILYTTVFTNSSGFFTGLVGSLGYWLVQQDVERGSQPIYFYILVQIPVYEFLTAIGSVVAIGLGLKKLYGRKPDAPAEEAEVNPDADRSDNERIESTESNFAVFFWLFVYWIITSILAFSLAGERMPWLTVHMAWPMVLFTGWGLGELIEKAAEKLRDGPPWWRTALSLVVLSVLMLSAINAIRVWFGATPPFQGSDLAQLQATTAFILPFVTMLASGLLLAYLMKDDLVSLALVSLFILCFVAAIATVINGATVMLQLTTPTGSTLAGESLRFTAAAAVLLAGIAGMIYLSRKPRTSAFVNLAALTFFGLLALQTTRTTVRANYILYDDAMEYLVYAHGARGVKDVVEQVEEISERTTGGLNAIIAYDNSAPDTGVSWPMVWYLRDYTALRSFDAPTRSLREAVAVIVDQTNFDKINPALGNDFYEFDYTRMWWPNQDYFGLDKTRVLNFIVDPNLREGIFDIWFDRDYTKYAQATGNPSMTLTTWQPASPMKLFIRKDVASQIWNYGVGPSESAAEEDPYEAATIDLPAELVFTGDLYLPLGLNAPRAIAAGLNDDFYVADSRNNRVIHIASDGTMLHEWGTFADAVSGDAPIGTFNEPWGIAVGPDGSVYVSDTWNHRVQKFSKDGRPLTMWGQYGQPMPDVPETASSFWGPRGVAVDSFGHVLVADTGNKRIVIFDDEGNYIGEFGTAGLEPGQFDEPVGVAVSPNGTVYITDTWNQRVQAFTPSEDGSFYFPAFQWDVNAWYGQSLDNKPFIAVGPDEHVFITDPEGYRIIEFASDGQFVRTWGDFGDGPNEIGIAAGVTVDSFGLVWVTDAGNNRILQYRLP